MVNLLTKFKNKKVFITGHTGFKGAWLSFLLDQHGAHVKGYSLSPNTNPSLYDSLTYSSNFISVFGDILDVNKLSKEIEDFSPDYIFHLAAQPLVIDSYQDPVYTFNVNVTGSLNVLECIRTAQYPIIAIMVTTDKVYENLEQNRVFKEEDKLGGHDPYSASKAAAEILISSYIKSFFNGNSCKVVSVRAGNVIGGGDWSSDRLIPDIVRSYIKKAPLEIRSPNSTRPWQHVLDCLSGYLLLANQLSEAGKIDQTAWNFGPNIDDTATVKDIVHIANKYGFVDKITYTNPKHHEAGDLQLDNSAAKNKLGWQPLWNAEQAIEKTLNWYSKYQEGTNVNDLINGDLKHYDYGRI
jgi:CDP-glucose 4,6-dehydratase